MMAWKTLGTFYYFNFEPSGRASIPLTALNSLSDANIFLVLGYLRAELGVSGNFSMTLQGAGPWFSRRLSRQTCLHLPPSSQSERLTSGWLVPRGPDLAPSFYHVSLDDIDIQTMTRSPLICPFLFPPFKEVFGSVSLASAGE